MDTLDHPRYDGETKQTSVETPLLEASSLETASQQYIDDENKDYGYTIFNAMLEYLFPNRRVNGITAETPNLNPGDENFTNCFEDGGFVFNDPSHKLFNILLGANSDGETDCRLNELSSKNAKSIYGTLDILQTTSHMLINYIGDLRQQNLSQNWNIYQLGYHHKRIHDGSGRKAVFIKEQKKTLKNGLWKHNGSTSIFERYIMPKNAGGIQAICNPSNIGMANTSYLKKGKGKNVLKFYCLKFVSKNLQDPKIFYITYVKPETTQHGKHTGSQKAKKQAVVNSFKRNTQVRNFQQTGLVLSPFSDNEVYPYRGEKVKTKKEKENWNIARQSEQWNVNFNGPRSCIESEGEECKKESNAYSGILDGEGETKEGSDTIVFPFLRSGYEFFVPSHVTSKLVEKLTPLRKAFCEIKYSRKNQPGYKFWSTPATNRLKKRNWGKKHTDLIGKFDVSKKLAATPIIGGGKMKKKTRKKTRKVKNKKKRDRVKNKKKRDRVKRKSKKVRKKKKTRKIY
jgi:hypothetical protein